MNHIGTVKLYLVGMSVNNRKGEFCHFHIKSEFRVRSKAEEDIARTGFKDFS